MNHVRMCACRFEGGDKSETVRVVSHIDADGISACSIIVKALNLANRKFSISTVQSLTTDVIRELEMEPYKHIVFTDIGSGQIKAINEALSDRLVIILDHHTTENIELNGNLMHVNPCLFGFDGGKEISGAGVVYLFCREMDDRIRSMAHIAIVGALGDVQENNGFGALNNEILKDAISEGTIKVIKGLRLFGAQTRPLHKVLEYCTDPYIPGVTGNESGSIQFLQQVGINPKNGDGWKKIVNLSKEEIKNLIGGIVMKRANEDKPEDVLGNVYLLPKEEPESPFRDAKEFATLLNATGRMGKSSLGIGACLGDTKNKSMAMRNLVAYKKEIINALEWFDANEDGGDVLKDERFVIIRAGSNVKHTIIGTLASILSRSNKLKGVTYILAMAQIDGISSKVSLRKAGIHEGDLQSMMREMIRGLEGCESGGHAQAAGAIIPTTCEGEFIKRAKRILRKKMMEEVVG